MSIGRYTLEDKDGNSIDFFETGDYRKALDQARADGLKVICNEYEFSDSYMTDDFTSPEDEA